MPASPPARVAFANIASFLGGAERSLLDILETLPRDRISPHAVLFEEGPLEAELRARGIPVCRIPCAGLHAVSRAAAPGPLRMTRAGLSAWAAAVRLAVWLRTMRMDALYSNTWKTHYLALAARAVPGCRVVWHLRDMLGNDAQARCFARLSRWIPARVIANSEATRHSLLALDPPGADAGRVVTIPNGIALDRYRDGDRTAARRAWRAEAEDVVLLHVGMLCPLKGQHRLLEAVSLLGAEAAARLLVVFAGAAPYRTADPALGAYRRKLETEVARRGLEGRVRFAGLAERMADLYAGSDIVVSCSDPPESFGRSLAEAMAAARPVVAFDRGGPAHIVDATSGMLVPHGSAEGLARAVATLAADPALRERMGRAGAVRAAARYDRRRLGPACARVLRETLFEGRSPHAPTR